MHRRKFLQSSSTLLLAPYLRTGLTAEAPISPFGATSTAEEVTANLDLSGKTALVTGCNSGIGLETMRVLALRGAHVIGSGRSMEKAQAACDSVEGDTTPVVLELSEFESVVACADSVRAMGMPIDMLICNAGMLLRELEQVYGLEIQFVVNHLGHFILVSHLLEQVLAAPEGRVVVVSSTAHSGSPEGGIQFDALSGEGWTGGSYYGHSKLANGLFSLELARQLEGTTATSNSLHPGAIFETNIMRNLAGGAPGMGGGMAGGMAGGMGGGFVLKTIPEGTATTCYVASYPELRGVSGCYFSDCDAVDPGGYMEDRAMASRLWEVSEALTRDYLA